LGYHLDHIIPCCAFNHDDPFEVWSCWHPDNFQWLPSGQNLSKSGSFNTVALSTYLISKKQEFEMERKS
jgi:hypothetical protein